MAIYLNNTTIKRGNSGIPVIYEGENLDDVLEAQDTIITAQDDLIANIQTALEGKAGVSMEYDTCTIEITDDAGSRTVEIWVSLIEDGVINIENCKEYTTPVTLNNVLCGSVLILRVSSSSGIYTSGSITSVLNGVYDYSISKYGDVYITPTINGTTATLRYSFEAEIPT